MDTELQQQILQALGLEGFPEEDAQDILDRVSTLVMNEIVLSAAEQLPDDQIDAYAALVDTEPDPDTLLAFFGEHVENFGDIVQSAVNEVTDVFKK